MAPQSTQCDVVGAIGGGREQRVGGGYRYEETCEKDGSIPINNAAQRPHEDPVSAESPGLALGRPRFPGPPPSRVISSKE
mmetsp:Transcript_20528/g.41377  ORF Transcript_20528/g.41377 Transcript_20528/m.41377 type:complete len:80 (-) Transcript_20528:990-1229(-)